MSFQPLCPVTTISRLITTSLSCSYHILTHHYLSVLFVPYPDWLTTTSQSCSYHILTHHYFLVLFPPYPDSPLPLCPVPTISWHTTTSLSCSYHILTHHYPTHSYPGHLIPTHAQPTSAPFLHCLVHLSPMRLGMSCLPHPHALRYVLFTSSPCT